MIFAGSLSYEIGKNVILSTLTSKLPYACVYVCVITYVRILVLQINLVSFYKELSLKCDFKYFILICHKDNVTLARI